MKRHDKLADTLPVGTLGILALESSHDMGKRVTIISLTVERIALHKMLPHLPLQDTTGILS